MRLVLILIAFIAGPAWAGEPEYVISITSDGFVPVRLEVPAGEIVKIVLRNESSTPVEFESTRLKKEKVLGPGVESFIVLRRIPAGEYAFFDDFNPAAAQGVIVARPAGAKP